MICDVLQISHVQLLSETEGVELKQPDYILVNKQSEEYLLLESFRKLDEKAKIRLQGYLQALSEI